MSVAKRFVEDELKRRRRPIAIGSFWGGVLALWVGTSTLAALEQQPGPQRRPRQLAPGVETVAKPEVSVEEERYFPRIWVLEFAYKPPRFITVEVPGPDGRLQRKLIWYLAYRVTNRSGEPQLLVPEFTLVTESGQFVDRVIPVAHKAIGLREDPARQWENSVSIVGHIRPTPERGPDLSVYGIATWEGVADPRAAEPQEGIDPRTDKFSIYITGLSNGYKLVTDTNTQTQMLRKTLKLNFWRPGDEFYQREGEIRSDIVSYEWLYWPGPERTTATSSALRPVPASLDGQARQRGN